ncbi:hypothetical protein [Paractinoplanes globisporus]|uniref:Uncharacterized protein n=1 Tax=Paractinoplanes globisporus TaxID=113565 RepID=A0ABW6WEJ8_9ACTN|nr:hypothetical protein [Actinoplanes globisporus]
MAGARRGRPAFHAAFADVPAPGWLGSGDDRRTVADRAGWDGAAVEVTSEPARRVAELRAATRPVRSPSQLIHGDLAGPPPRRSRRRGRLLHLPPPQPTT